MSYDRSLSLAEMPLLNGRFDHIPDDADASITAAAIMGVVHSLVSEGTSGAATVSRQSFTVGQTDVPGEPTYFMRWAMGTAATAGTPEFRSKVEDVKTFAGQLVTVQGFYRSDTAFDVKIIQDFGAGGSPSADVTTSAIGNSTTLPATNASGTAVWSPFVMRFRVPSISGKTIGSTANTSYLGIRLLFPLSTTYTVDFTDLMIHAGSERIPVHRRRPVWEEARYLERYYLGALTAYAPVSTQSANWVPFRTLMRAAPTLSGGTGSTCDGATVDGFKIISAGAAAAITAIVADARIAD